MGFTGMPGIQNQTSRPSGRSSDPLLLAIADGFAYINGPRQLVRRSATAVKSMKGEILGVSADFRTGLEIREARARNGGDLGSRLNAF
jgi:hypothetical protein